jgi:hypothetical protein
MSRVALMACSILWIAGSAHGQTRARGPIALPVSAAALAGALGLPSADPTTILVDAVRLTYAAPDARDRQRAASALLTALNAAAPAARDVAPLPLDPSIWRTVILNAPLDDDHLVSAILRDRTAALIYLGLSALDDETLTWLGAHADVVRQLCRRAPLFAAFGRSVHIRSGRVLMPGGADAEPLWRAATGVEAGNPADVMTRILAGDGRLAFLYDTIAHLDAAHQRFALGLYLPATVRADRLRALLRAFEIAAPDWRAEERPFARPPLDGAILLSAIAVRPDGTPAPPIALRLWERVFRADALNDVAFERVSTSAIAATTEYLKVDASWLAARILTVPYAIGRRRLDALLLAQRVFGPAADADPAPVATALRGYFSFPALMLTLERTGVTDPSTFAAAAEHASTLSAIGPLPIRRTSIAEFQSAIVLIQRAVRADVLDSARADRLIAALSSLDVSARDGYGQHFSRWFRDELVGAFRRGEDASAEATVLSALAGVTPHRAPPRQVKWEDRAYLADPPAAELRRLQLVRERQRGKSLDAALTAGDHALADALVAVVYAVYLGDPAAAAVTSGNVAARHDFGLVAAPGGSAAWRVPVEDFDRKAAWRIHGSLLGLEAALARLTLRRVNAGEMPPEPRVGPQDRQTLMLTVALLNPSAMSDEARDAIVAAIRSGRARVKGLQADPSQIDSVARDGGLSEWRRRAIEWVLARGGSDVTPRFSPLELFWLGSDSGVRDVRLDAWGAATLPRSGCLCLEMPAPRPWEEEAGRASAVLGSRAADVTLRIAEALAELDLPASLTPSLAGYAMQDVLEHAQLSYADDWNEFGRAARDLPAERMYDYIAALTARGPLVPLTKDEKDRPNP